MSGIARGSALNLLGAGISAVTGIALVVVVTRALPKSTAGTFFALTSLFLLAEMVACLGTGTGLVYWTSRLRSLGRRDHIRAFQRVAFAPVVLLSLFAAAGLVTFSSRLTRLAGGSGAAHAAVIVLAIMLPLAVISDTLLAATRGHATMLPTVAVERIGRPLVQLGLVAVAVTGGSLGLIAGAWAVPWLLSSVLAWWWLARLGRRVASASPAAASGQTWREFWSFTWPRAVTSVVQLALQRLDIVLITVLIGPAHAAVYTAATRFLVVGQLSNTAVANAAQPRLAEVLAVDDRASAKTVYQSATAWIVLLTWPLYLLCAVFAGYALRLFGHGYTAGTMVVVVLAAAMLLATACGMVDMLLNMAGRTSWTLVNSVIALTVMVSVDVLLIPRIGILGAGIGWATAIIVNNVLPLTQLILSLGLHPFGRATLAAAALSAACFGALPAAARLAFPHRPLVMVAAVLVGGVVFLAASLHWRRTLGLPSLSALRSRRTRRAAPAGSPDPAASRGVA